MGDLFCDEHWATEGNLGRKVRKWVFHHGPGSECSWLLGGTLHDTHHLDATISEMKVAIDFRIFL